jgi:hypothetical protein
MEFYAKQMIDFQKSTFDKTFDSIVQVQDQAEKMTIEALGQMPWTPEEVKKVVGDSIDMFKNARDGYKKVVTDGFEKMEEMFVQA